MAGGGFSPKSNAALIRERDLEFRCKQLLITSCGIHEPHIVLVEQDEDRIVVLFTVQTLTGRDARTAFIEPGDEDPEVVVVAGFTF